MKHVLLVALMLIGAAPSATHAQNNAAQSGKEDDGGGSLALLPIVFSSPDTRYAFGALPQYVFQTAADTRPSNIRADLYYTQNKQFNFQVTPELWLPGDRSSVRAKLQYRDWPTSFYGVEPPAFRDSESFDERLFNGSVEFQRRVASGIYVGASYRFRWGSVKPHDDAAVLLGGAIPGSGETTTSGIGVVASYDTRNHVYLPTTGQLVKVALEGYSALLGSDFDFGVASLDARSYHGLNDHLSVAAQFTATLSTGEVPFRQLPGIGQVLRGYASARHIAPNRWTAQMEFRAIPVVWRLGIVAFAGIGDTHQRVADFDSDLLWAAGFGVRFVAYRSLRITIRQDFGFGRDSSGDYLDLNEAF